MKRIVLIVIGVLAVSSAAFAQTPEEIEKATMAAPRNLREGATVIKWKPDFTYDVVRKGTNTLVCYDQSGWANEAPFSVQCTNFVNLERVAQNKKFEAIADAKERAAALAAAEKDGTRIKPEFGSLFITLSGKDKDTLRTHMTVAVPGATAASLGLPENNKQGGVWIMNAGTSTAHLMIPGS
jgi:hypothetical protein